jgi:integrase
MKGKITQKLIDGLKSQTKPFEVRDTEVRGFLLRVQPSGAKTYICQYARGKRLTLGSPEILTPYQARELAKEALARYVTTGIDPMQQKKIEKAHTFESFVTEKYKPWTESNHSRPHDTLGMMKAWYPVIGDMPLSDITAWIVEKQRAAWLKADAKPVTVNHKINYLKIALNKAVSWGLLQKNPLASVKPTKVDNRSIVRYLSDEEDVRLRDALDAREEKHRKQRNSFNQWRTERGYEPFPEYSDNGCVDHLKPLVLLALNTGLRRGELFNLKWADISFDRNILTVQGKTAKSGKTRHVPLADEASEILKLWSEKPQISEYVFPSADGGVLDNIKSSWTRLMKDAEIKNFRFHDCRHTFASRLVMRGVDLNTVRELLGHSSIEMTLRHAHLAPEKLASAIATLNTGTPLSGITGK